MRKSFFRRWSTIYKADEKEVKQTNLPIYQLKKQAVKRYQIELHDYKRDVTLLALNTLKDHQGTSYTGQINDELGLMLSHPPNAGGLSVPTFFEETDQQGNPYELIDLPKGYLFIFNPKGDTYTLIFHMEKPSGINPYLDVHTTWRQAYPALVRDGIKTVGTADAVAKLLNAFKII